MKNGISPLIAFTIILFGLILISLKYEIDSFEMK